MSVRIANCRLLGSRQIFRASNGVTVCAEIRIQPDPAHRWLEFSFDYADPASRDGTVRPRFDPEFASPTEVNALEELDTEDGVIGGSGKTLDGADEPVLHVRKLESLSGGTYEVVASVYQDHQRKKLCGRATAKIVVR